MPRSKRPTVAGPKLAGGHLPVLHTESRTDWEGKGWTAAVADEGATWAFVWQGQRVGGGYASRGAAKRGLERHLWRQSAVFDAVLGGP